MLEQNLFKKITMHYQINVVVCCRHHKHGRVMISDKLRFFDYFDSNFQPTSFSRNMQFDNSSFLKLLLTKVRKVSSAMVPDFLAYSSSEISNFSTLDRSSNSPTLIVGSTTYIENNT